MVTESVDMFQLPEQQKKIAEQIYIAFYSSKIENIIKERLACHERILLPTKTLMEALGTEAQECLVNNTKEFFELCNIVIRQHFFQYFNPIIEQNKEQIPIRLQGWHKPKMLHEIRVSDINKLGGFVCQVIARTKPDPRITHITILCPSCGTPTKMSSDIAAFYKTIKCSCGNKCHTKSPNNTFETEDCVRLILDTLSEFQGKQSSTQYIALLTKDLCKQNVLDEIEIGSKVLITGITRTASTMENGNVQKSTFYIEANYVDNLDKKKENLELTSEDQLRITELQNEPDIAQKIANNLFDDFVGELDKLKRALILAIVGGVLREGTRGTINILISGEPSTAKSFLLKIVKTMRLHPKTVYATGSHSSVAGLTAGILQDELLGTRVLIPGCLPLANNGICLIDEFDKFPKDEQDMMNDAIETGVLEINKIVKGRFDTKASIIMACNPIGGGKFDIFKKDFISQVDIIPSLLSRFDLIFLLEHLKGDTRRNIARKISARRSRPEPELLSPEQETKCLFYRKYLHAARKHNPVTNGEIDDLMAELDSRLVKLENPERSQTITFRHTEALCRIAEAHARLCFRDLVTKEDAAYAYGVVSDNLSSIGHNPETGGFDLSNMTTGQTSQTHNLLSRFRGVLSTLGNGKSITYDELWTIVQTQIPEWNNSKFNEVLNKFNFAGELIENRQGVYTIR